MEPKDNQSAEPESNRLPTADTGNASNPSPHSPHRDGNQLLNDKAEKYLRESGNIEDLPDAEDEQELGGEG